MTTPPQSPPDRNDAHDTYNDNDTSDIWASDSPPPPLPQTIHPVSSSAQPSQHNSQPLAPQPELSDLPSLRRQHMTTGYREGLSKGKARVIQDAFDKGYPIGVELGLRVGELLGVLEGVVGALEADVKGGGEDGRDEGNGERRKRLKDVEVVLERARRGLDVKALLAGVEEGNVADAEGINGLNGVEETVRQWEWEVLGRWAEGDEAKLVKGEVPTDGQRTGDTGDMKEVG